MAKRHTIDTHIGDYLREPASNCSLAAQGLLRHLEFIMSDGDRYGFLTRDGRPLSTQFLVRSIKGVSTEVEVDALLRELEAASVLRRHVGDILSCPVMIAKQQRRAEASQHGKRGGNPRLRSVEGEGVNPPLKATLKTPLNPTHNPAGQRVDGNQGEGDARGGGFGADDDPAMPDPEHRRAVEFVQANRWVDCATDRTALANVSRMLVHVPPDRVAELIREGIRRRATFPTRYAMAIVQREQNDAATKPKHATSEEWKKKAYVPG